MLVLSSLNKLLEQVLSPPSIHTAVLLTPGGDLVSYATHSRTKEDVKVLVGLGSELWAEMKLEHSSTQGMLDSEVGRIAVLPVTETRGSDPLLLVALNGSGRVQWGELQAKARGIVKHLSKPVTELEEVLER